MEPRLPIVLELLAGAARKSPGYAGTARRMFGMMIQEAGRHTVSASPEHRGEVIVGRALEMLLKRAVAPVPLALQSLSEALPH